MAQPAPAVAVDNHRTQTARSLMILGGGTFLLALTGALMDKDPFDTWFYDFAWWSYIAFVDGWVHRRRGESLLLSHPARFAFFAFFSVGLWFFFEALNLRLANWSYTGLPAAAWARWAGYVLGFATVVPALMETADLLDTAEVLHDGHVKPIGWKKRVAPLFLGLGVACLALPLLWPKVFFPLIWIAFIFLLDPLNERLGAPSLITDWREGSIRRLRVLLLAGILCGVLWETWNAPAGAHWVYHLPGLEMMKVFQMPLPGYLGFPLFAVEAFVMTSLALALWERASRPVKVLAVAGLAGFIYVMCGLVDRFTTSLPPL
jgi:hypothetical protein